MKLKHPFIVSFSVDYWPVGQGLFTSGILKGGEDCFAWVYDCGSWPRVSSFQPQIDRFLEQLEMNGARTLGLAVLSHFDADHINGIVALLQRVRVDRLMLPFLPLHERLLIAMEEEVPASSRLFKAFENPVAFLRELGEDAPREIIVVMPSGREGPLSPEEGGAPIEPGGFDVRIDKGYGKAVEHDNALSEPEQDVTIMAPGGRLAISAFWEFVPYNDAEMLPRLTPAFEAKAREISKKLLEASNAHRRAGQLMSLKRIYDKAFGKGSYQRNVVSLSLYSGPLGSPRELAFATWCYGRAALDSERPSWRCGQLYSGDAYLETPERFDALETYLTRARLDRHALFQVMHHGAEGNWHAGLASKIRPIFSVFSSDPTHKKFRHPHALVLRDFWPFGAVQVDKTNGFWAYGELVW